MTDVKMDNIDIVTVSLFESPNLFFMIQNWVLKKDCDTLEKAANREIKFQYENRSFVLPSELLTQIILISK